jgi:hypothetical protein
MCGLAPCARGSGISPIGRLAIDAPQWPPVSHVRKGSFFSVASPSLPRLLYPHIAVVVAAVLKSPAPCHKEAHAPQQDESPTRGGIDPWADRQQELCLNANRTPHGTQMASLGPRKSSPMMNCSNEVIAASLALIEFVRSGDSPPKGRARLRRCRCWE